MIRRRHFWQPSWLTAALLLLIFLLHSATCVDIRSYASVQRKTCPDHAAPCNAINFRSQTLYSNVTTACTGFGNWYAFLDAEGRLFVKGSGTVGNANGQLGLGHTTDVGSVVENTFLTTPGALLGCGMYHLIVLDREGRLWSSGSAVYAGYAPTGDKLTLSLIEGLEGIVFVDIEVSEQTSLALTSEGEVYAWGYNAHNALGVGRPYSTAYYLPSPVQFSGPIAAMAAGKVGTYLLKQDGTLWGIGVYHGTGTAEKTAFTQVTVPNDATVSGIGSGGYGYFFWDSEGVVYSTGLNTDYGFGWTSGTGNRTPPREVGGASSGVSGAAVGRTVIGACHHRDTSNDGHGMFLTLEGEAYHMGDGFIDMVSYYSGGSSTPATSTYISDHVYWVSCGFGRFVFLAGSSAPVTPSPSPSTGIEPTPSATPTSSPVVEEGVYTAELAVMDFGTDYTWSEMGFMSKKAPFSVSSPVLNTKYYVDGNGTVRMFHDEVGGDGLEDIRTLFVHYYDDSITFASGKDGRVWAIGYNDNGVLGIGSASIGTNVTVWTELTALTSLGKNISKIVTSGTTTLFLFTDGTVYGCGSNGAGQLGADVINTTVHTPTQLNLPSTSDIAVGESHSLVLLTNGTMLGSGSNAAKQLALSATSYSDWTEVPRHSTFTRDPISVHAEGSRSMYQDDTYRTFYVGENQDYGCGCSDFTNPLTSWEHVSVSWPHSSGITSKTWQSLFFGKDGTTYAISEDDILFRAGSGSTTAYDYKQMQPLVNARLAVYHVFGDVVVFSDWIIDPSPTPTSSPTTSASVSPSASMSASTSGTATTTSTATSTATSTSSTTSSVTVTTSETATSTITATATKTSSNTPTHTMTTSSSPSVSGTPSVTPTESATSTSSSSESPSASVTTSSSSTASASTTATSTATSSASETPSVSGSATISPTESASQSGTSSRTSSISVTATASKSQSASQSGTGSPTSSVSVATTASKSQSTTQSGTGSPTSSVSVTTTASNSQSASQPGTRSPAPSASDTLTSSGTSSQTQTSTRTDSASPSAAISSSRSPEADPSSTPTPSSVQMSPSPSVSSEPSISAATIPSSSASAAPSVSTSTMVSSTPSPSSSITATAEATPSPTASPTIPASGVDVAVELNGGEVIELVAGDDPEKFRLSFTNVGDVLAEETVLTIRSEVGVDVYIDEDSLEDEGLSCAPNRTTHVLEYSPDSSTVAVTSSSPQIRCTIVEEDTMNIDLWISASSLATASRQIFVFLTNPDEQSRYTSNNLEVASVQISYESNLAMVSSDFPENSHIAAGRQYSGSVVVRNNGPSTVSTLFDNVHSVMLQSSHPYHVAVSASIPSLAGWRCWSELAASRLPVQCSQHGEDGDDDINVCDLESCLGWSPHSYSTAACDVFCESDCDGDAASIDQICGEGSQETGATAAPWLPGEDITIQYSFRVVDVTGLQEGDSIQLAMVLGNEMNGALTYGIGTRPSRPSAPVCPPGSTNATSIYVTLDAGVDDSNTTVEYKIYHDSGSGIIAVNREHVCTLGQSGGCTADDLLPSTEYTFIAIATNEFGTSTSALISCTTPPAERTPGSEPRIESAELVDVGRAVVVTFTDETDGGRTCGADSSEALCGHILETPAVYGESARCSFNNLQEMVVALGSGATIVPGNMVSMVDNSCLRSSNGSQSVTGSVILTSSVDIPSPVANLLAPENVGPFERTVVFDGRASVLNGREGTWTWRVRSDDPNLYWSSDLEAFFSSQTRAVISLPAALIPYGSTIEVELAVVNYLSSSSSVSVRTTRMEANIPRARFVQPVTSARRSHGDVHLDVLASRVESSEGTASSGSRLSLVYRWHATPSDTTDELDTELATRLEAANGNTGTSSIVLPISLTVPASSLDVRVAVCYAVSQCLWSIDNPTSPTNTDDCSCSVLSRTVDVPVETPVVTFEGGQRRRVSLGDSLTLSTVVSDPNCDETQPDPCIADFEWSCAVVGEEGERTVCDSSSVLASFTETSSNTVQTTGTGTVEISVRYRNENYSVEAVTTAVISIVDVELPSIQIVPTTLHRRSGYVSTDRANGFSVDVQSSAQEVVAMNYRWSVETNDLFFSMDLTAGSSTQDFVLLPRAMQPGQRYIVTVTAWAQSRGSTPPSDGSYASSSVEVVTNDAPSGGSCYASPSSVAAFSEAELVCSGWSDSLEPLEYSFVLVGSGERPDSKLAARSSASSFTHSFPNFGDVDVTHTLHAEIFDAAGASVTQTFAIIVAPSNSTQSSLELFEDLSLQAQSSIESAKADNNRVALRSALLSTLGVLEASRAAGLNTSDEADGASWAREEVLSFVEDDGVSGEEATRFLRELVVVAPPADGEQVDRVASVLEGVIDGSDLSDSEMATSVLETAAGLRAVSPERSAGTTAKAARRISHSLVVNEAFRSNPSNETAVVAEHRRFNRDESTVSVLAASTDGSAGVQSNTAAVSSVIVHIPNDIESIVETYSISMTVDTASPYPLDGAVLVADVVRIALDSSDGSSLHSDLEELDDPVTVTFPVASGSAGASRCIRYDDTQSSWKSDNCSAVVVDEDTVRCECTSMSLDIFSVSQASDDGLPQWVLYAAAGVGALIVIGLVTGILVSRAGRRGEPRVHPGTGAATGRAVRRSQPAQTSRTILPTYSAASHSSSVAVHPQPWTAKNKG